MSDGHIVTSDLTTAAMAHNRNPTVTASSSNSDKTVTAEGYKNGLLWSHLKIQGALAATKAPQVGHEVIK